MKQEIVFLGNLEDKLSLVMKFGQMMLYYKEKFYEKFTKRYGLETKTLCFIINYAQRLLENKIFETS